MFFIDKLDTLTQNFYSKRKDIIDINQGNESLAKQVGWDSYENQNQGFKIATNLQNISWNNINSVLDVGCGYGKLVQYLRESKQYTSNYTGIDILNNFISQAIQNYGSDKRNTFIHGDILSCNNLSNSYDIIISMGTLSVNYDYPSPYGEKSKVFADKLVELMCSLAEKSVVLYFPNEDHTILMQRMIASDMAFYSSKDIRDMLIKKSGKSYKNLTIESYPNPENVKTIAKIYF